MSRGAGAVEETAWWLEVNGERILTGTAWPVNMKALAAGRLLAEGYIDSASHLRSIDVGLDPVGSISVRVRVPQARALKARSERAHRIAHGCGLFHFVSCDASLRRTRRNPPPMDRFRDLFREVFAAADRFSPIGGIHVAVLWRSGTLLEPCADVGRHNAVDRAIGEALLAGLDRTELGLLITSRISGEIALKAARAGLAWLASRSISTTLADSIARVAGLPLVARAPGPEATVLGGSVQAPA